MCNPIPPPPLPPSNYDYWVYEIESIELVGNCSQISMDELILRANKSIISANNSESIDISPAFIKSPRCIKETNSGSNVWIPCNPDWCCWVYFESHWTPYGGVLDSIDFVSFPSASDACKDATGIPVPDCYFNCKPERIPTTGDLESWQYIIPACAGACYYPNETTIQTAVVPFPGGGGNFMASYMVGTGNSIPCIGIHSFSAKGYTPGLPPDEILEILIRKALEQVYISSSTPPDTIRLVISKCWKRIGSSEFYVPCNDEDCCIIELEITGTSPLEATVVRNLNSAPNCVYPCGIEICSKFPETSVHQLPKLSINDDIETKENNIKIIPNPTTGVFSLEFDATIAGTHQLKVVDLRGFEVFTYDVSAVRGINTLNLDLTNIPFGVYYLQVLNDGKMISSVKFIKN
jgi:hypothetical protein